jgi:peptide-methionine (S)-S-oxide reductase
MRWLASFVILLASCGAGPRSADDLKPAPLPQPGPGQAEAVFAGGCFWCLESDFDQLEGVVATTSGFAGGKTQNPTYEQVGNHQTDEIESVHVIYDTKKLSYERLLDYFWRHIDPTDGGGQFCDRGDTYRPAVLYLDDAQKTAALASKKALEDKKILPGPVVAEVIPAIRFWPAENYHQDFHRKESLRYTSYRTGCGRDERVKEVWAKDSRAE